MIPVYNVEKYLRECIDSVIAQSYPNKEIILVNDGSTDNSIEICKEYDLKYPYIKLINKKNGGLSDARNVGILNSTGDYILFLDSDDYWDDGNFLFDLAQYINKNSNIDYIFFRYKIYFQKKDKYIEPVFNIDDKEIEGKSGVDCLNYILSKMRYFQWYAWAGIVRREFIINNDLFFMKDRKYEDILWTPQVFIKARLISFYNKPIYVYRLEREGQITSENSYKCLEDNIFISTNWFEFLENCSIKESLKKDLFTNINQRYFHAIKFAGFLNNIEKRIIIKKIIENKKLLKYCNAQSAIIKFSCNFIGFKLTISLLHLTINIKNSLKKFRSAQLSS